MSTTVEVIADAIKEAGTPFIAGHQTDGPGDPFARLDQRTTDV